MVVSSLVAAAPVAVTGALALGALGLSACSSDAAPPSRVGQMAGPTIGTGPNANVGTVPVGPAASDSPDVSFIPSTEGSSIDTTVSNKPGACGNGTVDLNEACDDGNVSASDGCSADCAFVEEHWSCVPGHLCVYVSFCGDSTVGATETCDDGNVTPGDGCSDLCLVEANWKCPTVGMPCVSAVTCGDGLLNGSETCDDGNTNPGDGCSGASTDGTPSCQTEAGWTCSTPGTKCIETCGDGIKIGREDCDDGNATAGDGCSATCSAELGFECDTPGQACRATVCGDGKPEGGEACDDANNLLGDGCSPGCKSEPDCKGTDGCRSSCGDGLILPGDVETCDDGNRKAGDGCSADCQIEVGFTCETLEVNTGNTLTLPIVYRDFEGEGEMEETNENGDPVASYYDPNGHPDFEHFPYSEAAGDYPIDVFHADGLVGVDLSPEGRPVYTATTAAAKAQSSTQANFDQWFSDVPGVNVTLLGQMDLRRNGAQNPYVFDDATFFPLDDLTGTLVDTGKEKLRNVDWNGKGCWKPLLQQHECQGDTPCKIDGDTIAATQSCPLADNYDTCVAKHNFSFTSELRYWFEYKGGEQLVFRGDDDVFVYINRKLVVDLGGLHEPLGADVCGQIWGEAKRDPMYWDMPNPDGYDHQPLKDANGDVVPDEPATTCGGLSASTTDTQGNPLNLKVGTVYEVALFQAERHTCQSNYQLSLSGFTQRSSSCMATCGDGMVASTEVCDEGTMNGTGYGHCTANCTPGPHCGDGVVDAGNEDCDNGVNGDGYYVDATSCAPGCHYPPFCGDGQVDTGYSEQCDNGANNNDAVYGGCTMACLLGPRCGDGLLQTDTDADGNLLEECDDGNIANNDGCSVACKKEPKFTVK
ncbi:MAG TPA: DUF4215 domain-containing protein [Polyangiaceae bacterium]|nr:DUF4215 domain-containing protein [Polyangiaceae bacterium]